MKPKAEDRKRTTALDKIKRSQSAGVDELATAYRIARGAPAVRMPALRAVLRVYLDACEAIIDGIPATHHREVIDRYLRRLLELRAHSLQADDWKLDVLDWLQREGVVLQYLRPKKTR